MCKGTGQVCLVIKLLVDKPITKPKAGHTQSPMWHKGGVDLLVQQPEDESRCGVKLCLADKGQEEANSNKRNVFLAAKCFPNDR